MHEQAPCSPYASSRRHSREGLGRYLHACAADQAACLGFGAGDPWTAYDELVDALNANPQPASVTDPRLVDGDDVNAAAEAGDYSLIRQELDFFYGLLEDGTYDPASDRYYALGAHDARGRHDL